MCGTKVTESAERDKGREIGDPQGIRLVHLLLSGKGDVCLDEKLVVVEFPVFVLLKVGVHKIVRAPEEPRHCPAQVGVIEQPGDARG